MGKISVWQNLKNWIASIGWKLFIWGNNTTEEEYWESIYEQELSHREHLKSLPDWTEGDTY